MLLDAGKVTAEALSLSSEARAALADRLVESLDPAEDIAFHALWAKEARSRLKSLRSGTVKGIPGEAAIADLRKKYVG